MRSRTFFVFLILILLGLGSLWWSQRLDNLKQEQSDSAASNVEVANRAQQDLALSQAAAQSSSSPGRVTKPLNQIQLPRVDQVKSEMLEDAHVTPESLSRFADELTPHLEQALASRESAAMVFQFLEQCVLAGQEVSDSIKMMCMINARRVSQRYPETFGSRSQKMLSSLPYRSRETVKGYFQQ